MSARGVVRQQRPGDVTPAPCITLSPRRIICVLSLIILALTTAHIILMTLYALYPGTSESGANPLRELSKLFDMDSEGNPPAWYSSFGLLVCSGLLGIIAFDSLMKKRWFSRQWIVLAIIFLYLALDEGSGLHDRRIISLRSVLGQMGISFASWLYSWVLVAIPVLLIFGSWYWRFLLHLPRNIRLLFLLAAATYIGGAVGVETMTWYFDRLWGGFVRTDTAFVLLVAVEESAEMVGALIFIHALMSYIRSHVGEIRLRFDDRR
jgi:hypothetical protein